ncbi:MAG: alanine--tRNA ligase [Thermodesulfobacteriaceae bacterium]|nr:alanine--tRNA ligase [Thermodesulfobacteriaceae bacterium]MCX8041180.1 alanine--tRNA ligase [Thermodesulfobacteriaceae bacterium]
MKLQEIRELFINYFKNLGHEVVPSSSLIPHEDPTLLFTNAGMVQFKKVFLGEEIRSYTRAVSCQKCMRAGGKHNDLDNVGYTPRHHTFFEMLGNFSFGDYFKEEAIFFAWEFITKYLNLPKDKLYVTVFKEDEEAVNLWKKIANFSEERIARLGEKDNFWAMGEVGPCGPCSEIVFDQGEHLGCGSPNCGPGCDCDRFLEIWNLVFMQYEKTETGELKLLPKPCIDTGMGLERVTAVVQKVSSNYEIDLFKGIISEIEELSQHKFKENKETEVAFRVIADHIRASTFLLAEGIVPSNEGRGYVLRRIIRRAERFGRILGLKEPFLYKLVEPVAKEYQEVYPEVKENKELAQTLLKFEEKKFLETLNFGMEILEREVEKLREKKVKIIPGELLFKLYDTYGFPYDLVRDYVLPLGFSLDLEGFETLRAKAREESRKTWKGVLEKIPSGIKNLLEEGIETNFVGYETLEAKSKIIGLIKEKENLYVITEITPFYPEGGGQVGDTGWIIGKSGKALVESVEKLGNLIYHRVRKIDGLLQEKEEVILKVDQDRRFHIARHHTATHLLQAALRKILGSHVRQSGSLVDENRLRFDFTHFQSLSPKEIKTIEEQVNQWILENHSVEDFWMKKEEAEKLGALAIFEEKYEDLVRVIKIDGISIELCGGTHVKATGEIGLFKIVSEGSVASGIRRIEALAGLKAFEKVIELEERLFNLAQTLKTSPSEIEKKLNSLIKELETLKQEVKKLKSINLKEELENKLKEVEEIKGIKVLITSFKSESLEELRELGDYFKNKIGSGIFFLLGERKEDLLAVCMVSKDLTQKYLAHTLLKGMEALGLKGGGKAELAQGSFKEKRPFSEIKEAFKKILLSL